VLLPGLDAKQTPVGQVMTGDPVTVKPDDQLEGCMAAAIYRPYGSHRSLRQWPMLGHQPKAVTFDARNLGAGHIE
jgi:hypothetical protein